VTVTALPTLPLVGETVSKGSMVTVAVALLEDASRAVIVYGPATVAGTRKLQLISPALVVRPLQVEVPLVHGMEIEIPTEAPNPLAETVTTVL
jgi:hypothetical protein